MNTLTIECGHCRTSAELPASSVLVEVGDEASADVGGTLSWICDRCHEIVTQPVRWSVLLLVVAAGALLFDEDDDPLPPHPEAPPAGGPLSEDDLLDLHKLLSDPTWFTQLQTTVR